MALTLVKGTAVTAGTLRPPFSRNHIVQSVIMPPGMQKRPPSNLLDENQFTLSDADNKGFPYFCKMPTKVLRNDQVWASIAAELLFPNIQQVGNIRTVARLYKDTIKSFGETYTNLKSNSMTKVKKTGSGFEVSIPVFSSVGNPDKARTAAILCLNSVLPANTEIDVTKVESPAVPSIAFSANILKMASLDPVSRKFITGSNPDISFVSLGNAGSGFTIMLTFRVSKTQTEYLCQNKFDDVRPIDMYGIARTWANSKRDTSVSPPEFTRPLANIASTLPAGGKPRLSEDGILIDQNADLYWLPDNADNISVYDTALSIALMGDDGSMGQMQEGGIRKLPPSQMVFLDWINNKWTYVTAEGNLRVQDLSRARPCNITQIRNLLATKVSDDTVLSWISQTLSMSGRMPSVGYRLDGVSVQMFLTQAVSLLNLNPDYEGTQPSDLRLHHIATLAAMSAMPSFSTQVGAGDRLANYATFSKIVSATVKAVKADAAELYRSMSVTGTASYMAIAVIFDKYAHKFEEIHDADRAARAKYLAPETDPSYELPAVPYIAEGMGYMPHQGSVRNQLRDSPDNAVLGVDAGGGKSMLVVTDILTEILRGNTGPFLVACPSHLVPQYIEEFSHFTQSRINTIPITRYTISKNGYDGLEKMIDAAPLNTVVLTDYNLALGKKSRTVGYGTSSTVVFEVVEFLRKFNFQYIAADESHKLKNPEATISKAIAQLMSEIPKRRLASGTFIANAPEDIAGQYSLLDPSVFGSKDKFNTKYFDGRKMKPGAELEIKTTMRENARYVQVKRKEWASILPKREEKYFKVDLSPMQRKVYDSILQSSMDAMLEEAKRNPKLAALLGISGDVDEKILDDLDEDSVSLMEGGLDALLKPYLARLEQFLCAPGKDLLGNLELKDTDRLSPKIAEFAKHCRSHIAAGTPGKILAFTNQTASASEIYENLPPDLKAVTILFLSGDKEALGAAFKNDSKYKIMIGVGTAMEVGLNLQFCSVLCRLETVMSPAALEQGNSRVGRPNIKEKETRTSTQYWWISVDRTIDVTKVAYLLTKKVRIASIEEAGNPNFTDLEIPELFKLTLDNIAVNNTYDTLADYLGPEGMYKKFMDCQYQDYADFAEQHKDYVNPDGSPRLIGIKRSEDPKGSAIMRRLPYVPGQQIYGTRDLGLIRFDDYMRTEVVPELEDDQQSPLPDSPEMLAKNKSLVEEAKGLAVHTEQGEGEIVSYAIASNRLRVRLYSGEIIKVNPLTVFVITKPQTSGKDIRAKLAKAAGSIPIDTPFDAPDQEVKLPRPKRGAAGVKTIEAPVKKRLSMALNLVVTNDYLSLELENDEDKAVVKTLKLFGFVDQPSHFYTLLKQPHDMLRYFKGLKAAGMTLPPAVNNSLIQFYMMWVARKKSVTNVFGLATTMGLRNFYLLTHKPPVDKKQVNAYISMEQGQVYLCLPSKGQPGNRKATTIKTPNIRFYTGIPTVNKFFQTPAQIAKFVKQITASGVELTNEAELFAKMTLLKKIVQKATKEEDVNDFFAKRKP